MNGCWDTLQKDFFSLKRKHAGPLHYSDKARYGLVERHPNTDHFNVFHSWRLKTILKRIYFFFDPRKSIFAKNACTRIFLKAYSDQEKRRFFTYPFQRWMPLIVSISLVASLPLQADTEKPPSWSALLGDRKGVLVPILPFYVPLIRSGRLEGTLGLRAIFRMKNVRAAEKIKNVLPRVQDALLRDFYNLIDIIGDTDVEDDLNLMSVKIRILHVCTDLLGDHGIADILLGEPFWIRIPRRD